ncbi:MAG TPA: helix-turn-helix domain-containing protein [Actinomycetes bacterium]|jgi:transposase-like protein|nr:helix-turn-helix domain-containing protein [Actinomycetes bacterium]
MILLFRQGFAAAQIAGLLGYDPSSVRRWIHRYQKHGTPRLADRAPSTPDPDRSWPGPGMAPHRSIGEDALARLSHQRVGSVAASHTRGGPVA